MYQSNNLSYIILLFFLLLSSILSFVISKFSFEFTSLPQLEIIKILVKLQNLLSLLIPTTIYVFYLITTKIMFEIYFKKFNLLIFSKIIAYSFLPIFINYIIIFIILIIFTYKKLNGVIGINDFEIFGVKFENLNVYFTYSWVFFYIIFSYLIYKRFRTRVKDSIIIAFLPTIILISIKYIFSFLQSYF